MARKTVVRLTHNEAAIVLTVAENPAQKGDQFLSRPLGSLASRGLVNVLGGYVTLGSKVDAALIERARGIVERDFAAGRAVQGDVRDSDDSGRDTMIDAIDAGWDACAAE